MNESFIIFEFRNKKLLLPFGMALVQIILNIINLIQFETRTNQILESDIVALSRMALIFIPIYKKSLFGKKKEQEILKGWKSKNYLHYILLIIIYCSYMGLHVLTIQVIAKKYTEKNSLQNPHNSDLSMIEGFELIVICIFSIILLKYKYYFHHILSIAIFIIICFFLDLIIDNFKDIFKKGALFIILSIIVKILDGICYVYQKYMMDVLYHSFWSIGVFVGIGLFLIFGTGTVVALSIGREKVYSNNISVFLSFFKYFDENSVGMIILKHSLNFIFNFILNIFRYLTIFYLTPEYILISFTISRIFDIVMETKKYECIALFVVQFIALLLYLEIIELNFLGINKNTKRNIISREKDDKDFCNSNDTESSSSLLEIYDNYIIDPENMKETKDVNIESNSDGLSVEMKEASTVK